MTEHPKESVPDAPYRPWRLLVLLGWVLFVLVHDKRIPGLELNFTEQLGAAIALMVLSWFVMPNRRAELLGLSALIAVGVIGFAAGLSLAQKLAMIGVLAMLALGCALWLLRHASLRLRLIVIGIFLGIAALEIFLAGFESLVEAAASS